MDASERLNILLVDDQPAKLLAYETILEELGENLLKAGSAREALELLLKHDVAIVLMDVCDAGHRRLRARQHDPPAPALREDRDHLRLRRAPAATSIG